MKKEEIAGQTAVLNRDVRWRRIDEEAVVVNQDSGEVLVLNELGSRVLQLVEERRSVGGMIDLLLQEYDVGRDRLEEDVLRYLGDLERTGIIAGWTDRAP